MTLNRILVVGANVAGLKAVESLRQNGFDGKIVLIGDEFHLPYDRPPLSKQILTGDLDSSVLAYRDAQWFRDQRVDALLGKRATALDVINQRVSVDDGDISFDGLIIATGARPRTLPIGEALSGMHTLRTLDDALALKEQLHAGARVVVIGAGFIGAEVASSARLIGAEVTVLEAAHAPLIRAFGATTGAQLGALHEQNGVQLLCNAHVHAIRGRDRVQSVVLSDGTELPADVVVVGIGCVPNTEWLAGSGLDIDNGLVCDRTLNVGHDRIYAAGDVASWLNEWSGTTSRSEQWTVSGDQGRHAAANLLAGREAATSFSTAPYFWSDQYGVKIQSVGRTDIGQLRSLTGTPVSRPFLGVYEHEGRVVGALAINSPRAFSILRGKISSSASYDEAIQGVERFITDAGAVRCE